MRTSANLPHDLWPETVAAAVYILNRTPIFRTGKTPFEAFYVFQYNHLPIRSKWHLLKLQIEMRTTILHSIMKHLNNSSCLAFMLA